VGRHPRCYSAADRDADQHGEGADRFDINHASGKHLAFGGGIHSRLGASWPGWKAYWL
jgi:cytochrome P450